MSIELKPNILIIDDEKSIRDSFRNYLEDYDYKIMEADDGETGLKFIKEHPPDIVLLDLLLPKLGGLEVLREINQNSPEIPVIVISGTGDIHNIVEALRLGAWDYLVKPLESLSVLKHAVEKALMNVDLLRKNIAYQENLEAEVAKRTYELKNATEALRQYKKIVDAGSEIMSFVNKHYHYLAVNKAFLIAHNKTRQEIVGHTMADLFGEKIFNEKIKDHIDRSFIGEVVNYETQLYFDGIGKRYVEMFCHPSFELDGTVSGVAIIIHDITRRNQIEEERSRLQSRLEESRKMESIATLAGGIAHKFNNALVGITGNIELLNMDYPENDDLKKYTTPMINATQRMMSLTNQLLAYARGGKYRLEMISVKKIILSTLEIIKHDFGKNINLHTDFIDDTPFVEGDSTQLQMVISAVLNNAVEAIKIQGDIVVSVWTCNIDEDSKESFSELGKGEYVCISVKDTGSGMDLDTKNRIFEPFFTTKFQGRGLGMAAVYGIIRNHGGSITVDTDLGTGSTVTMYLPALHAEHPEIYHKENIVESGKSTILVIEDEVEILDLCKQILESLNYKVLTADNGMDAIDLVHSYEGDIDVAILDIVLPDMNGKAIYHSLKKIIPGLKVIICSGYDQDGPAQEILDAGAQAFVQKPFSFLSLSDKIQEILRG